MTHGPPQGILDANKEGEHYGCKSLRERVRVVKPKVHIFGHTHDSHGSIELEGIRYYNVAMVSEAYQLVQQATLIELTIC